MALIGREPVGGGPRGRKMVLVLFAVLFAAALVMLLVAPSGFALMAVIFLGGQLGLLTWLAREQARREARLKAAMAELQKQEQRGA